MDYFFLSMRQIAELAPDADCFLFTGIPNWRGEQGTVYRTFELVEKIEVELGKTIISSEIALLYSILRHIEIAPPKGYGKMLDSLSS
jgi:hypothetical protein